MTQALSFIEQIIEQSAKPTVQCWERSWNVSLWLKKTSPLTPCLHCTRLWHVTAPTRFCFVLHAVQTPTRSVSEVMQLDSRDHVICWSDVFYFSCVFLIFGFIPWLNWLNCYVLLCPALLCCSLHTKLIHLNVQLCVTRMKDLLLCFSLHKMFILYLNCAAWMRYSSERE